MKKIAVVTDCRECPHFDYEHDSYAELCEKLNRTIKSNGDYGHDIPSDCPLDDADEAK
jgi:hypothetical protein